MLESSAQSLTDKLDLKILELLQEDANATFVELARKLNTAESTVRKRIEGLREKGVIQKFSVVVNPHAIGLSCTALVGLDVEPGKLLEVAHRIRSLPQAKTVAITTGDHMIMVEIWAKNTSELSQILSKNIGAIDGVTRVCPSIVLERLKV